MNLIMAAAELARSAHEGQTRKYNGTPYVRHPARVAARTALFPGATEEMVAAAFLHDVIEDTSVRPGEIAKATNQTVAEMVVWMTNPSKGSSLSRAERKTMDREHLAKAPREVKIIKMLDRIDNLSEMDGAQGSFVALYVSESLLLADVVGDADESLRNELIGAAKGLESRHLKGDTQV
jgi:(p)ppGpp synthase/HD superfamily hydrolase